MYQEKSSELKCRLENQEKENVFSLYPPFPTKNLLIEVTNACNYKCIFCANRKMTRKKGMISQELLEKVLSEAFELGAREVGFYTTGEPLLYEKLEMCILKAKEIGFKYVYLTTNGFLATPDRIESLVISGLDSLKFSINAVNKESYLFIHGKDAWDIVLNNLIKVNELRKNKKYNLKLYVSYIMTRYTKLEAKQVKSTFSQYCDEVLILNVINQCGLSPENNEMLSVDKLETDFEFARILPCSMPFNKVNVSFEGYLTACCTDFQNYLACADLNKSSLKEAWNCEEIVDLRRKHLDKNVARTLCNNCIYGVKTIPTPLKKELAVQIVEEMFDETLCENRINKFLRCE